MYIYTFRKNSSKLSIYDKIYRNFNFYILFRLKIFKTRVYSQNDKTTTTNLPIILFLYYLSILAYENKTRIIKKNENKIQSLTHVISSLWNISYLSLLRFYIFIFR